MCGICGILCLDGGPVDPAPVERMRDAIIYRGPDSAGLSRGPGFALGHRRLAIIDLSEAAHQPMTNEDGRVQVVFNGEIYNFLDLRPQLEAAGHRFRSRSDTEVLVHGYEEWGFEGLLKRIRGMFAFALVDTREGLVHLARDPLGKKPLFFRLADGELAFASSARALVHGLRSTPEVDPAAVDDLLANSYIPGRRSIFRGVEKLLPAHGLTVGRDGLRKEFAYWEPDFFHPEEGVDREEWLDRIEAALTAAVRRRLIADVPLGVMLSGGIDSSLVTALAARVAGRVKTYCVATDEQADLDESGYARAVAERYGTEHHVLPVRSDIRHDLPGLVAAMGEPCGDSSAATLFAISKMARRQVTVVLTGDGGDEGFGGYNHFLAYYYTGGRLFRHLPAPVGALVARGGKALRRLPGPVGRAGPFLRIAAAPVERTFGLVFSYLEAPLRAALFTPDFAAQLAGHDPQGHYPASLADGNGALPVDRVMQGHLKTDLADGFLVKVDVATMGASLEARSPFLDLDVMELAMRVPAALRFTSGRTKGLLRQLAYRHIPAACIDRPKHGFNTPTGLWVRNWPDLVQDLVLGPQVERRGWFRRAALESIVRENSARMKRGPLLWTLMVLELWLRMTVDGSLNPGDSV